MWKIEVDTPLETDEQYERHEQYPKVVVGPCRSGWYTSYMKLAVNSRSNKPKAIAT
jgi:hypothetical protein